MENTQITIADLMSLKNLLEAACTRGAFKATEMTVVGQVYDKLARFVDQSTAQLAATQKAQGEENA